MRHDEFIGEVQNRARLPSRGDAERVTRATLETLGERLAGGSPSNLASQLPPELGRHLEDAEPGFERLSLSEFWERAREKEGADLPEAIFHARAVVDVLRDAVGDDQIAKIMDQLPEEFAQLVESGSEGSLDERKRPLGEVDRDDWGNGERRREEANVRG